MYYHQKLRTMAPAILINIHITEVDESTEQLNSELKSLLMVQDIKPNCLILNPKSAPTKNNPQSFNTFTFNQ